MYSRSEVEAMAALLDVRFSINRSNYLYLGTLDEQRAAYTDYRNWLLQITGTERFWMEAADVVVAIAKARNA